jgi:diguanylate cyclase (GGDEF)-like protein
LEQNTQHFAQKYHEKNDPNAITFEPPPIHTHNEVESLSKAITQMAADIRIYIQGIISAKEDAKTANEKAADMTLLAYRDTLTHVGSKIAYEETKTIVDQEIQAGKTSVAIAMVDLNNLKRVNDSYGHAHGDSYLFGSIQIICQVFKHSAIFRYGGDEFVILFKDNNDFKNRKELVQEALEAFQKAENDTSKQPWERYSAAIGLADYTPGDDMDSIFKRADSAMYQVKTEMKKHMN